MPEQDNWDNHWDCYAAAASRNPAQQMRHDLIIKLLLPHVGADTRVLDIGSGQGDFLAKLHRITPLVAMLGFELSSSGVEISRRKLPAAKFYVADLFHPPEAVKAFTGWATAAVCSEVLEHVDSPVDFLRSARPYLSDGARLIVTVPGGPMSSFDHHIGHRQHFTRESIRQFLEQAGFSVEHVYLSGFPFFNLYRCAVIVRGDKLAADVKAGQHGFSVWLARMAMSIFRSLFKLNLMRSPFGWQVVVVAHKTGFD